MWGRRPCTLFCVSPSEIIHNCDREIPEGDLRQEAFRTFSRTRDLRRTDVIVDYHGRQYIIELKIWHGDEYNKRGEQQLVGYLEDYHVDKGYMLSFNFNRKKQSGIRKIIVNGKTIVEAVV